MWLVSSAYLFIYLGKKKINLVLKLFAILRALSERVEELFIVKSETV